MRTHIIGLALGLLTFATQAQAQMFSLPEGTYGLSPITGKITKVEQRRIPVGEAVTGSETRVTLQFTLAGCLDQLMPLVTHSEIKGQTVTFYITALNAHTKASQTARCFAIPQASTQVTVPGIFQQKNIRLVFLGQDRQI